MDNEADLAARRRKKFLSAKSFMTMGQKKIQPALAKASSILLQNRATFDVGGDNNHSGSKLDDFDTEREIFDEFGDEIAAGGYSTADDEDKRQQTTMDHFRNGLWVVSAGFLFIYLDIHRVLTQDYRVKQSALFAGGICTAVFLVICAYHVVWLTWIKKVKEDAWDRTFPLGVPLATIAIILSGILYVIAFWNVWSIFTPFILFAFTMPIIILLSYL